MRLKTMEFLVLACMEYHVFQHAKIIEFGERDSLELSFDFVVTTFNHRNIFSIPQWQCPAYFSPEFFGAKIRKIDDEYELTFGLNSRKHIR